MNLNSIVEIIQNSNFPIKTFDELSKRIRERLFMSFRVARMMGFTRRASTNKATAKDICVSLLERLVEAFTEQSFENGNGEPVIIQNPLGAFKNLDMMKRDYEHMISNIQRFVPSLAPNGFSRLNKECLKEVYENGIRQWEEKYIVDEESDDESETFSEMDAAEDQGFLDDEIKLMEAEDIPVEEPDDLLEYIQEAINTVENNFPIVEDDITALVNNATLKDFCKLFPLPPPPQPILIQTPYYF